MEFVYLPVFVKRLKDLSKKYSSIKNDFSGLLKELEENPDSACLATTKLHASKYS